MRKMNLNFTIRKIGLTEEGLLQCTHKYPLTYLGRQKEKSSQIHFNTCPALLLRN